MQSCLKLLRGAIALAGLVICFGLTHDAAAEVRLNASSFGKGLPLSWSGNLTNGIATIEWLPDLNKPWQPWLNVFSSNTLQSVSRLPSLSPGFLRLQLNDISHGSSAYIALLTNYANIETIAGHGDVGDDVTNAWDPSYEGGSATGANLSRPHFAMADLAGNIYIVDKNAHAVRKMVGNKIYTVAGTGSPGDDGNALALATQRRLSFPNGLWVMPNGSFYILDQGNGKIRRVSTSGVMSTVVAPKNGISGGRSLCVSADESHIYFADGKKIKVSPSINGTDVVFDNLIDPGNIVFDPLGRLVITDRGANLVWRLESNNSRTIIAGTGSTFGGGDGALATDTALFGVRGVWFLPGGQYLLATHEGSRIWYVDLDGIIHLFVDGSPGGWHTGDGGWFHTPGAKISEVRSISMDFDGNILIVENDFGYVRRISFERKTPSP